MDLNAEYFDHLVAIVIGIGTIVVAVVGAIVWGSSRASSQDVRLVVDRLEEHRIETSNMVSNCYGKIVDHFDSRFSAYEEKEDRRFRDHERMEQRLIEQMREDSRKTEERIFGLLARGGCNVSAGIAGTGKADG